MISNSSATYDEQIGNTGHPTIVFADDDAVVRSVLAGQLQYEFDCVGSAADADQAIELVERQRPSVVILDVNMPGGGAARATREISARVPETTIVVLSVDELHDEMVNLLIAGATVYLRKGIDTPTLIATLHAATREHLHSVELRRDRATSAVHEMTPPVP